MWLSPASQPASEGQDPDLDGRQKAEDLGDAHHVNARHLLYPNSPIVRFPVPNEKVPWEVSAVPAAPPPGSGAGVLGELSGLNSLTWPGTRWAGPRSFTGTCWTDADPEAQAHTA